MAGKKQGVPIPKKFIFKNKIVLDVIAAPENTALLKAAKMQQCICISGKAMHAEQRK